MVHIESDEAWRSWLDAGAIPRGQQNEFAATTKSGLAISGFFDETTGMKAPTTAFVEASWF